MQNVHGTQATSTGRGPPGSTIIIYKELIRFNNTHTTTTTTILPQGHPVSSRQGAPLREGFLPHFVGGIHHLKSLLFSPYPAIPPYVVRTPHPGRTDDRAYIRECCIHQQHAPIHVCHAAFSLQKLMCNFQNFLEIF